jgi:hypothetical protein
MPSQQPSCLETVGSKHHISQTTPRYFPSVKQCVNFGSVHMSGALSGKQGPLGAAARGVGVAVQFVPGIRPHHANVRHSVPMSALLDTVSPSDLPSNVDANTIVGLLWYLHQRCRMGGGGVAVAVNSRGFCALHTSLA